MRKSGVRRQPDSSNERGIALVIVMFLTLVISVIGSSMMFLSRTETLSSYSYKTTSQARYAAESGLHRAVNHLLWNYQAPGTPGAAIADNFNDYVIGGSSVTVGGEPVVLSSSDEVDPNYPVEAKRTAFKNAAKGTLDVNTGSDASFTASARLVSMQKFDEAFTNVPVILQTWEVTGRGFAGGNRGAEVEVTAIVERQESPVFKYAAFAVFNGCDALKFGGGAITDSYDSRLYNGVGEPATDAYGGNVGTNGNMSGLGNTTTVNGSLSTPRKGVGKCEAGDVNAFTDNGATITGGVLELGQAIKFPTPTAIDPLPPIGNVNFNNGCGGVPQCAMVGGAPVITPPVGGTVTLADVRVQAGTTLTLKPGTYIVNSLSFSGNATIKVDTSLPGNVIIKVAGQNKAVPVDFTGGSISNDSYDPERFQIIYGGDKAIKLTGGASNAALVYAPNASASFSGGADFYGAVVAREVTDMGGAAIHYDRKLGNIMLMAGNPMLGSFTWKTN